MMREAMKGVGLQVDLDNPEDGWYSLSVLEGGAGQEGESTRGFLEVGLQNKLQPRKPFFTSKWGAAQSEANKQ